MLDALTTPPQALNEKVLDYAPGSAERYELESRLKEMAADRLDLTMAIGGERRLGGGSPIDVVQPHRHAAILGTLSDATTTDVKAAVAAAKAAAPAWRRM